MTESINFLSDEIIHFENYTVSYFVPTRNQITNSRPSENGNKLLRECSESVTKDGSTCSKNKSANVSGNEPSNAMNLSKSTGLIGILILISSVFVSSVVTLWPQHNSITHPEYWYEGIGIWIFGHTASVAISDVFERNKITNNPNILCWKALIQHLSLIATWFLVTYVTTYLVWVQVLHFCHPMPFTGLFCYMLQYLICWPLSFWLLFPSNMKTGHCPCSRNRIIWFICLMVLRCLLATSYAQVTTLMLFEQEYMQPKGLLAGILGVFLPFVKKLNIWWHRKISLQVYGNENEFAELGSIIVVGYLHSFSLALLLGSTQIAGSTYTKYFIMLSDCIFNSLLLLKILKLHKNNEDQENLEKTRALKCLALKEFLEILVPTVYMCSFVIAYYGPNAYLIGNVKNDYWQFERVNNLVTKFENVFILLVIEICRGILFGMILWHFCRINMYLAYCYIVRNYGLFILFFGSAVINGVNLIPYCFRNVS